MKNRNFGIEIEMTGITKEKAANAIAAAIGGPVLRTGFGGKYKVVTTDGREWKIVNDGSIRAERKANGQTIYETSDYSVEVVSPILTYANDIEALQTIVRALRKAGDHTNDSCGIHVHVDGEGHTVATLKNWINLMASKGELLYKALKVELRRTSYCKLVDCRLVEAVQAKRPKTLKALEDIWYARYGYEGRSEHYHESRYHILNLHSFFHGVGTVEIRGFNSTLHAGEIRSYVALTLAMDEQARTQKAMSSRKPQTDNEKFAMRTWLNRIGLIGDEYKACREHLTKSLDGCAAWRHGRAA